MNLILTQGRAKIDGINITYIPHKTKNQLGNEEIQSAIVGSDIEFENGDIEFGLIIKEKNALCQAIFNSDTELPIVVCGFNTSGFQYGTMQLVGSKWETLHVTGDLGIAELDRKYNVKISVLGSFIDMYVDGVKVVSAYARTKKSQIKFLIQSDEEVEIQNIRITEQKPRAFVIMQFSPEYNQLYEEVIKPVTHEFGIQCERADEYSTTNPIIEDIVGSIREASVIIADITPDNPNVFYEVGYAHAINKPTILLSNKTRDKLPFDVSSFRTLFYDNTIAGKTQVETRLRKFLENIF